MSAVKLINGVLSAYNQPLYSSCGWENILPQYLSSRIYLPASIRWCDTPSRVPSSYIGPGVFVKWSRNNSITTLCSLTKRIGFSSCAYRTIIFFHFLSCGRQHYYTQTMLQSAAVYVTVASRLGRFMTEWPHNLQMRFSDLSWSCSRQHSYRLQYEDVLPIWSPLHFEPIFHN